jgi:hypothetical protein
VECTSASFRPRLSTWCDTDTVERMNGIKEGVQYVGLVFAAGFMFGILRNLALNSHIIHNETTAVAMEIPMMLIISWYCCRWIINKSTSLVRSQDRVVMSVTAFGLLMLAELSLTVFLLKRTVLEHFRGYQETSRTMGLLAQIGFGIMPIFLGSRIKKPTTKSM